MQSQSSALLAAVQCSASLPLLHRDILYSLTLKLSCDFPVIAFQVTYYYFRLHNVFFKYIFKYERGILLIIVSLSYPHSCTLLQMHSWFSYQDQCRWLLLDLIYRKTLVQKCRKDHRILLILYPYLSMFAPQFFNQTRHLCLHLSFFLPSVMCKVGLSRASQETPQTLSILHLCQFPPKFYNKTKQPCLHMLSFFMCEALGVAHRFQPC